MDGPAPGRGLAARAPEPHDMHIDPFELERWQSLHEHHTAINLAESGVHPLRVGELAAGADRDALLDQALEYTQTNGTAALRDRIAALYDGASAANVLVTNGSAEANLLACWQLIEPGDEAVVVHPVYMQIPGLIRSFGATVREVWLEPGPSRMASRPRRGARGRSAPAPGSSPSATRTTRRGRASTGRRSPSCAEIAARPRLLAAGRRGLPRAPSSTAATRRRHGAAANASW